MPAPVPSKSSLIATSRNLRRSLLADALCEARRVIQANREASCRASHRRHRYLPPRRDPTPRPSALGLFRIPDRQAPRHVVLPRLANAHIHAGMTGRDFPNPQRKAQCPHPCGHDPAVGLRRRSAAHAPARRARPAGRAYTGSTSAQSGPANGGTSLPAPIGLGIAVNNRNDYSDERNRRSFDGCLCGPGFSGLLVMNRFSKIARGSNEFHERRPCRLDGGNPR